MDLRLSDVERVLLKALDLGDDDLTMLRGRILHLRRTDTVVFPKPKPGRQIVYGLPLIRELFVALRLNEAGVRPDKVKTLLRSNGGLATTLELASNSRSGDLLVAVLPATWGRATLTADDAGQTVLRPDPGGPEIATWYPLALTGDPTFDLQGALAEIFRLHPARPVIVLNASDMERVLRDAIEAVDAERRAEEPLAAAG